MKKSIFAIILLVFIVSLFSTIVLCSNAEKEFTIKDFLMIDSNNHIEYILLHTFKDGKLLSAKISNPEEVRRFTEALYNYKLIENKETKHPGREGWYIEFYGKDLKMSSFCYVSNDGIDRYSMVMSRNPMFKYNIRDYDKLEATLKKYKLSENEYKEMDEEVVHEGENVYDSSKRKDSAYGRYDFAVSLMKQLPKDKNYMFSPLSIKMAFAMAANGAKGQTQAEILELFAIGDLQKYNKEVKEMMEILNKDEKVKFNIANSIWFNTDYFQQKKVRFTDAFKKTIAENYQGIAAEVNKKNAVDTINQWISKNTEKKINNVISDSDFLAALVNTVYFKGAWASPFQIESTVKKTFTDKKGVQTEADFMNQTASFHYYEDENIQSVALPYRNRNINMYILLPRKKQFEYTSSDLEKMIGNMKSERVWLSIPKFKVEFDIELSEVLKKMGLETAFSDKAEFRGPMIENSPENICISQVIHKTYIDVDEGGTEAAAATAIMMRNTAVMQESEPKKFNADHPFLYFIRDQASGEILFMGEMGYVK
ncbi:MAG: serpin family protein [Clostridia bacterium]|nr:serpin family protein [Clostridia bacterium]